MGSKYNMIRHPYLYISIQFAVIFIWVGMITGCATQPKKTAQQEMLKQANRVWVVSQNHPTASDQNPGTQNAPLQTISAAAQKAQAGDVILVHKGVYRETVKPVANGTASNPIRIVASYNEEVEITGTESLTNWQSHTSEIYKAKVDHDVNQLFLNRWRMIPARFPNSNLDWTRLNLIDIQIENGTGQSKVELPQVNGATFWGMNEREWVAVTSKVKSTGGNNIHFAGKPSYNGKGRGMLYGSLDLLDFLYEWAQEDRWIYFQPQSAEKLHNNLVEITKRRWAFDLSQRSYIEIHGFNIFAASINMVQAHHCQVRNSSIQYPSFDKAMQGGFNRDRGIDINSEGLGIALGGHHNIVENCVIANSLGDGISVYGQDNQVVNCVIHDCNFSASDCAPINCTGTGHIIRQCTLFDGGRSLIVHRKLRKGKILNNHLFNAGLITNDLGATYTFQSDGQGTEIAYNIVHDVHCHTGVGIYVDNFSPNHIVHHNLSYNNEDSGIRLNTPTENVLVYHNTVVENGNSISYWGANNNDDQSGVEVANNIMTDSISIGEGAEAFCNYTQSNPGFQNPAMNNFALRKNSPCVDAAVILEDFPQNYLGKAPDIGCYEYGQPKWQAGSTIPQELWLMDKEIKYKR